MFNRCKICNHLYEVSLLEVDEDICPDCWGEIPFDQDIDHLDHLLESEEGVDDDGED